MVQPVNPLPRRPQLAAPATAAPRASRRGGLRRLWRRLRHPRTPLVGALLMRARVITPAQLAKALAAQDASDEPLGRIVVQLGLASEDEVLAAINRRFHIAASALDEDIETLIRSRAHSRRSLHRLQRGLRFRLTLVIAAVIWITILALSLVMLTRQLARLRDNAVHLGAVSLDYLAEGVRQPLQAGDVAALERQVRTVARASGAREAVVTDSRGNVRARAGSAAAARRSVGPVRRLAGGATYTLAQDRAGHEVFYLRKAVMDQSRRLGTVELAIPLEPVTREVRREALLIGLLSLLILLFGVMVAIQQGGRLLRPLSAWLASMPGGGAGGEYRVRVRPHHEFEDLAASFDRISRELGQKLIVERSFGRYVNPAVLKQIRANPEQPWFRGQRNEVSVLFADVRGFTAIAETREPEEVVEALNEYFAVATAAIVKHGGYVDKFIGDAVLGVFGVPATQEDHALRAVRSAMAMQKQLRRRARNNLNPFLERIGIGVNTGVVVSGNIGSEDKLEYTVIGDCVNVASRLNGLAAPGEVIISDAVAQQIPTRLLTMSTLDAQHVKGKKAPVTAHKVLRTEF